MKTCHIRDIAAGRIHMIGIGGSATNDCGIGMLSALGFAFLDENGRPAGIDAAALGKVTKLRTSMERILLFIPLR